MADSTISLFRAVPGPTTLFPLVKKFCRGGEGLVTSLEDLVLPVLKEAVQGENDVQVIPFGALVKRILESSGQSAGLLATRTQHIAALGQASAVLEDSSPLRKSLRFVGTREAVAEIFSELHGYEIDLESIRKNLLLSEHLRISLQELYILERKTNALLADIGRTLPSRQLLECFDSLLDPDIRLPRLLVLVGGNSDPLKVRWLRWLGDQGCEITVIAPRHPKDLEFFRHSGYLAKELGCSEQLVGSGSRLAERLFTEADSAAVNIRAQKVISANPTAECEWAIEQASPESAVVFVRDLENYAPLLESAARASGKSVQLQRRIPLMENAFAQMTLQSLRACTDSDVRKFLPLLKLSYLRTSREVRIRIQECIEAARNDMGSQWEELGTRLRHEFNGTHWLEILLEKRLQLLTESHSLSWWIPKLRELVDILPWQDTLDATAGYDPQRDERAFSVMQSSLSTEAHLEQVGEPVIYSFRQFVARCKETWGSVDVSVPALPGLSIVSSAWALPPRKEIFILGMLEGVFPRRRRENPILSDSARQEISALNPVRRPLLTSRDSATLDREEFYAICASAGERLVLSYPAVGDEKDNIPTFYLNRVEDALGELDKIDNSQLNNWRRQIESDRKDESGKPDLRLELGRAPLAREKSIPVKPAELRDALQCPFKYQMRHNLNLDSGARTSAWFRLRFLPENAGLVAAKSVEDAERSLQRALKNELDRLAPQLNEWEIKLLKGGGERLILEWIKREFVAREIWPKTKEIHGDRALGEVGLREVLPGNIPFSVKVAALSHLNSSSKVVHLFESSAPDSPDLDEGERLYYGLYFLAMNEPGFESVIEVDGMDGNRSLLVFNRDLLPRLASRNQERLKVVDLSGNGRPQDAKRDFIRPVKESLKKAFSAIESGDITATPGQHCEWCDYGEICRQSSAFFDLQSDPFDE